MVDSRRALHEQLIIVMDNTILDVAIPSLTAELGATNSRVQWIIDSYVLEVGINGMSLGRPGAACRGVEDNDLSALAVEGTPLTRRAQPCDAPVRSDRHGLAARRPRRLPGRARPPTTPTSKY